MSNTLEESLNNNKRTVDSNMQLSTEKAASVVIDDVVKTSNNE
jgi:hypothetical protein